MNSSVCAWLNNVSNNFLSSFNVSNCVVTWQNFTFVTASSQHEQDVR